jgi:hypothetical protein
MSKKKPRKPSRPVGHFVLPKAGGAYRVYEQLPDGKEQLERVIVEKFRLALEMRFARTLTTPEPGEQWPDFWTTENGWRIAIEITEVVNLEHIRSSGTHSSSLPVAVDRAKQLLKETIERKVAKAYSRSGDWVIWLLVYDNTNALVSLNAEAARVAHQYLSVVPHPFTEVWLMTPMTGDVPSFLESVWPTLNYTSTG